MYHNIPIQNAITWYLVKGIITLFIGIKVVSTLPVVSPLTTGGKFRRVQRRLYVAVRTLPVVTYHRQN